MFTGNYKFADHTVCIQSVYEGIHRMCADYRSSGEPETVLSICEADIRAEVQEGENFPPAYLETLAVYRKLALFLLDQDVLLFHASAVAVDNRCYLFTALSGTGKSTHVRLWRQLLGDRVVMVNDDKPLLGIAPDGVTVFGTPWDGKHRLSTNTAVPLQAVCLVTRGETNRCDAISPNDILEKLLHQTFLPDEPRKRLKALALLDALCRKVRFYKLQCNMEPEAAVVSYRTMAPQSIEDLLRFDGGMLHHIKGVSMRPLLHQQRDLVFIEAGKPVQLWDTVLFRRAPGIYVLHRVTAVRDGYYEITGDNCLLPEKVLPEQVLGVMTRFIRKGKEHSVTEKGYLWYVRIWNSTLLFRRVYGQVSRVLRLVQRVGMHAHALG